MLFNGKEFSEIPFGKGVYFICKETTEILSLARPKFPKILKQVVNRNGYLMVGFFTKPNRINVNVHRAMMLTFVPNPNNYEAINHIDGNKLNNQLSNLEWCTNKYNIQHAVKTGLHTDFGQKEVHKYDLKGNYICSYNSLPEASADSGVTASNICYCLNGKTSRAGKYTWSYSKMGKIKVNVVKETVGYNVQYKDNSLGELSCKEVCALLSIGKTKFYRLLQNKHNSFTLNDYCVTRVMA